MSDNNNKNDWYSLSDSAILRKLGAFVRETRLKKNHTQNNLAIKAGVHRATVNEFEQGKRGSLTTFIQLLRALNELELLDVFKITTAISPLQMAKLEAKKRQRASATRSLKSTANKKIPFLSRTKKGK